VSTGEVFHGNASLFDRTSQGAESQRTVERDDAAFVAAPKHHVAAFLSHLAEAQAFERAYSLPAGYSR
jgi:hypothetical protein